MTCLCWSWDHEWLACTSDKGTAHVFHVDVDENETRRPAAHVLSPSSSLTQKVWNSVSRRKMASAKGEEKSMVQIRGVPQPLACAFVPDRPHTLSVVGRDTDGNGVLLLSDFSVILDHHMPSNEAARIAYHVVAKSSRVSGDATYDARSKRWRTPVGNDAAMPSDEPHGKLYVGERLEVLENQMNDITFDEEEGFVSISTGNKKDAEEKMAMTRPSRRQQKRRRKQQQQQPRDDLSMYKQYSDAWGWNQSYIMLIMIAAVFSTCSSTYRTLDKRMVHQVDVRVEEFVTRYAFDCFVTRLLLPLDISMIYYNHHASLTERLEL
jgi:superfamily I DNA/RNA helicase